MQIFSNENKFGFIYKCDTIFGFLLLVLFIAVLLNSMMGPYNDVGSLKGIAAYDNQTKNFINVDLTDPESFPLFF